jgi:hypothetical protein
LWAGFKVLGWVDYRYGVYLIPRRSAYYWCDPKELIADIESNSGLKFPDGLTEIKAAKSIRSEGAVFFIIRFTAEPNVLNAFFNTLPEEVIFNEYNPSYDVRTNLPSILDWFKKPIQKGKIGIKRSTINPEIGQSLFYIDMINDKSYVVYWRGYYY